MSSASSSSRPAPTDIIGRERDVARLTESLLADDVRLVTITGPGGVGKTRLAIAAAGDLEGQFPDGVVLIPLEAVSDPLLVIPTIVRSLGLRVGEMDPVAALQLHVREQLLLLVLDNFEQVAEAGPQLVELLVACANLKLLVTSRSRLRVSGEHEFPLSPLAVPNPDGSSDEEDLTSFPGVALFVERARAISPDLQFEGPELRAIADVCRELDGLPLAIELAAARVKLLSPETMLDRLERRLELLTGGPRDLPERQQTLRKTIEWSYDLLDENERTLFRRLSVFVGGCTLEFAESVGNAPGDMSGMIDALGSLVDKSLLRQVGESGGQERLAMLETIREFAAEELARSDGDEEAAREAHAAAYLEFVETAGSQLTGPEQVAWLNRLDVEQTNLRAALDFSLEQGRTDRALRFAAVLWAFWLERGYLNEGRRRLRTVLEESTADTSSERAKVLCGAGILAHYQSDYAAAEELCSQGLALFRALGDARGEAMALNGLALATRTRGDFGGAQALFEQALTILRELGDKQATARTLDRLGIAVWFEGDDEKASAFLDESLVLFRELEDAAGIGLALVDLGLVSLSKGDGQRAKPLLGESLELFREVRDRRNTSKALYALGDLERSEGDQDRASRHYGESLNIALEVGDFWFTALCLERLAGIAEATGDSSRAARVFGGSDALRERIGAPMPAYFRRIYDRDVANAREGLDADAFESGWTEGGAMPIERLVATARAVVGSTPSVAADELTTREREVLALVAEGQSDAEVAERLVLSVRTVHAHLRSIYRKLGVHSRSAATRYAVERGFVSGDTNGVAAD